MAQPLILPPLRRTAEDAQIFAYEVHKEQVDKAGQPYSKHLDRVVNRLRPKLADLSVEERRNALQIAWLHDVIEDTPFTDTDLRREGFSEEVVNAVDLYLTKLTSSPYLDWIGWIGREAPLPAILVKIADVEDNSDPARLTLLDETTRARLERKYAPALVILREAAQRLGWTPPLSDASDRMEG